MSHNEPTQTDADSEGQTRVPEPEVVPRAKRRQYGQIISAYCRRAEFTG